MLFFISHPGGNLKPPTWTELAVLFWLFVLVLFGFGVVLIYLSFGQPPEKHELAMKARWIGGGLTLLAIAMPVLNWTRQRYTPW